MIVIIIIVLVLSQILFYSKESDIEIIEKCIVLKIDRDSKTLAGGIVKKRLSSLGDALNLVPKLVIEKV